jgi:hypothetical protein
MGSGLQRRASLTLRAAFMAVIISALSPTAAHADFWCWLVGNCGGGGGTTHESSPQREAPEIDPGALASAIALAAGGAVLLGDRVRRRR